jgi:hypothetical protein
MYVYLGHSPRDLAFISVTLILFVAFTVLSLLPQARQTCTHAMQCNALTRANACTLAGVWWFVHERRRERVLRVPVRHRHPVRPLRRGRAAALAAGGRLRDCAGGAAALNLLRNGAGARL